jgi:hypothetical protein
MADCGSLQSYWDTRPIHCLYPASCALLASVESKICHSMNFDSLIWVFPPYIFVNMLLLRNEIMETDVY